jgi:hypothetical protein
LDFAANGSSCNSLTPSTVLTAPPATPPWPTRIAW